jgi:hypothetical protein
MATRTISLKDEAYNRLRSARRYPGESFSEVVLRATWPEDTVTAAGFLRLVRSRQARFSDDELDRVEEMKRLDQAPEDKWAGH